MAIDAADLSTTGALIVSLAEFLHAAADAVLSFEPEPMEPYSGAFDAAAEALKEAQEAQQ